jgi:hypothetical protein
VNETAKRYGACVEKETPSAEEAYAPYGRSTPSDVPEAF